MRCNSSRRRSLVRSELRAHCEPTDSSGRIGISLEASASQTLERTPSTAAINWSPCASAIRARRGRAHFSQEILFPVGAPRRAGDASPTEAHSMLPANERPAPAASSCRGSVHNLVDPASSHMLVSKIKPCMSQYKLFYCKTANGSLKQLSFP